MPLTPEQKRQNRIDRMVKTMEGKGNLKACVNFAAKALQKAIRAEYACEDLPYAMFDGVYQQRWVTPGYCACVTCGAIKPWNGANCLGEDGTDAGHYLKGRDTAVLLDERNIHPQCKHCNRDLDGNPEAYYQYMLHRYGQAVIDELKTAKAQKRVTYTRHELAERRVEYLDRIKAAERRLSDA